MPGKNGHGPESNGVGRAALYLRVSSEEQRDRETIEIQRDFLTEYCRLYGLEIAGGYADDGVSGTIPLHERPEGRRLLEDAQAGRFDTLLVYRLDRLGRSLLVIVDAHDRLQAAGVSLRSATEPIDTSTPSGRLIFQMLASFAEYERETIREKTRDGLHRAYRNGRHSGRIPYGYRLSPKDESSLEIVEEEAAIVREIISNVAEGSTLYRESKRLNDQDIPSPGWRFKTGERKHGGLWCPPTVALIVHQSAYSGVHKVRIGNGETIERPVPPVVPPGLRERAEAALEENKRRRGGGVAHGRKNDRKYLLSGLVKCAVCGTACTGRTTTSTYKGTRKKYSYYGCIANRADREIEAAPHFAPHAPAPWLKIWCGPTCGPSLRTPERSLSASANSLGESPTTPKS
jgi:site-specific DNA recombinase